MLCQEAGEQALLLFEGSSGKQTKVYFDYLLH